MSKLFTVAGISTLNGVAKLRFATDMKREKVLKQNGHTDIRLIQLPKAMDKDEATAYLKAQGGFDAAAPKAAAKTKSVVLDVAAIKAKNLATIKATAKRIQAMDAVEG